jgi:hypothetical protein
MGEQAGGSRDKAFLWLRMRSCNHTTLPGISLLLMLTCMMLTIPGVCLCLLKRALPTAEGPLPQLDSSI